jgi:sec-independent protein translocase protein TatC
MKDNNKNEMTFLEHLEELRWNIIRSLIAVIVGAIIAFIFKNIIFDKIIFAIRDPDFITNSILCHLSRKFNMPSLCFNSKNFQLINISMVGQFSMHMWVSFFAGVIIAFPIIINEFWNFFSPALYNNEKKYARIAVVYSSILFFIGTLFGYFLITPLTIFFLSNYTISNQVINQININSYVYTIVSVSVASGVVFELPIIVYFLSKIGLMTPNFMRKYRKHAIVVMLIIAAIITPPDIFSQLLVTIPLIILYEISIFISKRVISQKNNS